MFARDAGAPKCLRGSHGEVCPHGGWVNDPFPGFANAGRTRPGNAGHKKPPAALFDSGAIRHVLLPLLGVPVDVLSPKALPEQFRATVLSKAVRDEQ